MCGDELFLIKSKSQGWGSVAGQIVSFLLAGFVLGICGCAMYSLLRSVIPDFAVEMILVIFQ